MTATLSDAFLEELAGRLDCYGPLWISISLATCIFMAHSLQYFPSKALPASAWTLLSSSLGYILGYVGLVGGGGWALLRGQGAEGVYLMEIVCLLGYSLLLILPVTAISLLHWPLITWAATLTAAVASAFFVYQNLHPVLRTSSVGGERAYFYAVAAVLLHVLFIVSLKLLFI